VDDTTVFVYNIVTCQKFVTYFRNLYILNIKHIKWVFTSKRGISWKVPFCNCNNSKSSETVFKSSRTRCIIRKKEVNIISISAILHPNQWFTVLWGMRIVLYWRKNWSVGPGALMIQFLHPCNLQMIWTYTSKFQSVFQQLFANSNSIIFVIRWWQIQDDVNSALEYWMVIHFFQLGQFHLFMHRICHWTSRK